MNQSSVFLILEKSDETRISIGIDGYSDDTGITYNYDNLVPNYKKVKRNDLVIIRKENEIVGTAEINSIEESVSEKIHRRCVDCNTTDIRERKTKSPTFKCGNCATEFDEPIITTTEITAFTAHLGNYKLVANSPNIRDIKNCSFGENGYKSQHSIMLLDYDKVINLIPEISNRKRLIEFDDFIEKQNSTVVNSKSKSKKTRRRDLINSSKIPEKTYAKIAVYKRNPDVIIEVLERSKGTCEHCGVFAPFLRKSDNSPYLEVHHKIRLADGGEDTVENAIAICPNCHRALHYG